MPLFRRFGRPGLLGAVARTAVIAGTATLTARAVDGGLERRAENRRQAADETAAPPTVDTTTQLTQLAGLRRSGTLTEAEYESARRRILSP